MVSSAEKQLLAMDMATLSERICCGESTIEGWIRRGLFPEGKMIGGKRLWRWKDVERHLAPDGDKSAASRVPTAEEITNATRAARQQN